MAHDMDFMDLSGNDLEVTAKYHGDKNGPLEARLRINDEGILQAGVGTRKDFIVNNAYDGARNSLDLYFEAQPGVITAGLRYAWYDVPNTIKEINVYDPDQMHVLDIE